MKAIKLLAAVLAVFALTAGTALAADIWASLETRGGPSFHSARCPQTVTFKGVIHNRVSGLVQYR